MPDLLFEWDRRKDTINQRKHRVPFEEAKSVFLDESALLIPDPDASNDEDRFLLLGLSAAARTLVVCHCLRSGGDTVRIISARKANRPEQRTYGARLER